jgi:hypothetical protein
MAREVGGREGGERTKKGTREPKPLKRKEATKERYWSQIINMRFTAKAFSKVLHTLLTFVR